MSSTVTHPNCIGFIMDGNRRWALEQKEETIFGHEAGEEKFYEVAQWIKDAHIPHAVFYAFSSENWNRNSLEVVYLQELFLRFTKRMLTEVHQWQVRVNVFGDLSLFSDELRQAIGELMQESARYETTTIWVALSYGGRAEIIAAVNEAIARGQLVNETTFAGHLATAGMPDPDLVIRTGGDMRLSNFLPWQAVYSELMFTPTYWPAFTKDEFMSMLTQYGDRKRRFGR